MYSKLYMYIIAHKSQRGNSKFVQDQRNVSHDSLMHACSLSASSFGKKNTFLGIIILIFFASALLKSFWRDDRLLCDNEISSKTQNYCLKSVCNFKLTRF